VRELLISRHWQQAMEKGDLTRTSSKKGVEYASKKIPDRRE